MYRIKIEKIESITKIEQGSFEIVGSEVVKRDDESYVQLEGGEIQMKKKYDYAPEHQVTNEVTRMIFEQTFDQLDLVAVIAAANAIVATPID